MLPKRPLTRITSTAFKAQTAMILQQINRQREPIKLTHNGTVQAVLLLAAKYPSNGWHSGAHTCPRRLTGSRRRIMNDKILAALALTILSGGATEICPFGN